MIHSYKIHKKEIIIKTTDKHIAETVGIGAVTFSRWKKERPALYKRIKNSFECEEKLNELELTLKEALKLLENNKK